MKPNIWTLFLLRTTTAQTSFNAILTSDWTTALTTNISLQPLDFKTMARILQPYNIRVAHNPMFTLWHWLSNVKDKDEPEDRPGAVSKIKFSNCQATYIGDTSRNLTTQLNKHKWTTKKGDLYNNIIKHHLKTSHTIDWDSATCYLQYCLLSTN